MKLVPFLWYHNNEYDETGHGGHKKNIILYVFLLESKAGDSLMNRGSLKETRRGSPVGSRPFPMQLHQWAKSTHPAKSLKINYSLLGPFFLDNFS